jgi:hypothetical protein
MKTKVWQTGKIAFRNDVQKALFDIELAGQISDGHWENASPTDHWMVWCNATTIVDKDNVGRDFHPKRDYYGFSSPQLLDVIEGRMLAYARMTLAFGIDAATKIANFHFNDDATGAFSVPTDEECARSEYFADKRAKLHALLAELNMSVEDISIVCINNDIMNHKQLVRELRDMSKICRTRRA